MLNNMNNTTNTTTNITTNATTKLIPGISGLTNLGNTCYLNAILQPLANTTPFLVYMINDSYKDTIVKNIKKEDLMDTTSGYVTELFKCMWREICTISPKKIKTKIGKLNDIFEGNTQNDSQEVLGCILDSIHEETKYKVNITFNYDETISGFIEQLKLLEQLKQNYTNDDKNIGLIDDQINCLVKLNRNKYTFYCAAKYWEKYVSNSYSIITDLFTGLFYTKTVCNTCGNISEAFDPFVTLSVEIKGDTPSTLENCLTQFSKEELLKGDDSYSCNKCKIKVEANKRIHIWQAPEILIIHLKNLLVLVESQQGKLIHTLKFHLIICN